MSNLALEEQEQIEQLKAFWKRWGNVILVTLTLLLGSYVAWSQWGQYQQAQSLKASAMFDEMDKVAASGDVTKITQVFSDFKVRYPKTLYAQQAGLLAAKYQFEAKQSAEAVASLAWVSEHAMTEEYKAIALLRLAGVLYEDKKFDEALKHLGKSPSEAFEGLFADRRGDILMALEKRPEAIEAYTRAWGGLEGNTGYRRLVESKLGALGVSLGDTEAAGQAGAGAAQ